MNGPKEMGEQIKFKKIKNVKILNIEKIFDTKGVLEIEPLLFSNLYLGEGFNNKNKKTKNKKKNTPIFSMMQRSIFMLIYSLPFIPPFFSISSLSLCIWFSLICKFFLYILFFRNYSHTLQDQ